MVVAFLLLLASKTSRGNRFDPKKLAFLWSSLSLWEINFGANANIESLFFRRKLTCRVATLLHKDCKDLVLETRRSFKSCLTLDPKSLPTVTRPWHQPGRGLKRMFDFSKSKKKEEKKKKSWGQEGYQGWGNFVKNSSLQNRWTPDLLSWERPGDFPQSVCTNVYFLWGSGGIRDYLLEAVNFTAPATSNSTVCSILMTIFNISKWTEITKAVYKSGSGTCDSFPFW